MALTLVKRLFSGAKLYFIIAFLLLALAYLMSITTQDSSKLSDLFLVVFGLGVLTLFLLAIALTKSLLRLYYDFKNNIAGSRLTARLVSLFILLILASTITVYGFSVRFLHSGINSWFNVDIEQALDDSLDLGRSALGIRMRTLLRQTRMMAGVLSELPSHDLNRGLRELAKLSGALELSIWNMQSRQMVTFSTENPSVIVPNQPNEVIFSELEQGKDYIGLDPSDDGSLQLRAAIKLPKTTNIQKSTMLHVIFPVDKHLIALGKKVQNAYNDYRELSYLRKPLISIFILTLSLIVLLTVLMSIWFAIWIASRIVHPLKELADSTQSVAKGNYNTQPIAASDDEIGFLVRSFNQMTEQLAYARNSSQKSHQQLEKQTDYLATVLENISSGVITFNDDLILKTANTISATILQCELQHELNLSLNMISNQYPHLTHFTELLAAQAGKASSWQQELELAPNRQQILMCRGTPLPNNAGWVVVFDDVTTLIQAQRNAAWSEVAQRLAHEIKNPLTPIQLCAERLQHKYQPLLPQNQTDLLIKLTETIIQQVKAMKDMVNDFSNYARRSGLQLQNHIISELINDVLALYHHHISLINNPAIINIKLDGNGFRQVLHNIIKNAIEASEDADIPVMIEISYHLIKQDTDWLELKIRDYGPGIPHDMIDKLFEPYITNKSKGTGLGLAIVKKIIEEHDGTVWAENLEPKGACIIIRLPYEEH